MAKPIEMSKYQFSVAYAGDKDRADHSISVEALAPALLAFGRLMREANTELNGKKSKANVSVVSDFENKCFNINFEIALSFFEQVRALIQTDGAKDAKEILEWLGLLAGSGIGLFQFLRWLNGRKIKGVTRLTDASGQGNVIVEIEGDDNSVNVKTLQISHNVFVLAQNSKVLRAVRDTFIPVGREGFDRMEVRDHGKLVKTIDHDEARSIAASCTTNIKDDEDSRVETIPAKAWLSVYSPVYDEKAPMWRFKMGMETIHADISETEIAQDAIKMGGSLTEDLYLVNLEVTTEFDNDGKEEKKSYKVLEVLDFVRAKPKMIQQDMFDEKGGTKK